MRGAAIVLSRGAASRPNADEISSGALREMELMICCTWPNFSVNPTMTKVSHAPSRFPIATV
jgi:hypothetical protein